MRISDEESKWRAEDDAHTLAEAEKIKMDSGRLRKAKEAASRMVREENERLKALRAVAGANSPSSPKESKPLPAKDNVDSKGTATFSLNRIK